MREIAAVKYNDMTTERAKKRGTSDNANFYTLLEIEEKGKFCRHELNKCSCGWFKGNIYRYILYGTKNIEST